MHNPTMHGTNIKLNKLNKRHTFLACNAMEDNSIVSGHTVEI
jgi:hypothetical protein